MEGGISFGVRGGGFGQEQAIRSQVQNDAVSQMLIQRLHNKQVPRPDKCIRP